MQYTCEVQLVHFRWDQVEDRGPVDSDQALRAFREFPFKDQELAAKSLSEPTSPTVTFRGPDQAILAIWSIDRDEYEVYLELQGRKVTVDETSVSKIESLITRFFAGERKSLFSDLEAQPSAVRKLGLIRRVCTWLSS